MSDWYQAIIDTKASPEEAAFRALRVTTRLIGDGVIEPGVQFDDGTERDAAEYIPGPRFAEASGESPQCAGRSGKMEVHLRPWVNDFGVTGLELAHCSICDTELGRDYSDEFERVKESFGRASAQFLSGSPHPNVSCPVCNAELAVQHWQTQPHLGFCHLAFTFWNWPPFKNWNEDVPARIGACLGHGLVLTYGRL